MSYIVPGEIPTKCNHCPFGHCNYSLPFGSRCRSMIDRKMNDVLTKGYVCNLDHQKNGRYTMVMRANIDDDVTPILCPLRVLPDSLPSSLREAKEDWNQRAKDGGENGD